MQPPTPDSQRNLRQSAKQTQFLDVLTRDEATRRFEAALHLQPLGVEQVKLLDSLGRVLSANIVAEVDVPAFDRGIE